MKETLQILIDELLDEPYLTPKQAELLAMYYKLLRELDGGK